MRKVVFMIWLMLGLLAFGAIDMAFAQDDVNEIAYGDEIEGEITADQFELDYVFMGNEGDLVMIQMLPTSNTSQLDPKLQLKSDTGEILVENDDFIYPSAVLITSLPAEGEYTITATRFDGQDGDTEGGYTLRLTLVEPLTLGETIDTQILADSESSFVPELIVLHPEDDLNVRVSMEVAEGDIFAALVIMTPDIESYTGYTTLVNFDPNVPIYNLSLELELNSGQIYVIYTETAFASFSPDAAPLDVSFTFEEVE
jgi:hypothetical protein